MLKKVVVSLSLIGLFNACIGLKEEVKLDVLDFYETKVESKVNKSEHFFPKFFKNFKEKDCELLNENNDRELMKSFFARNKTGPIGKKYVKDMMKKIKNYDKDSLSELELAVIAVDFFRKDISRTHGKGKYTDKHEKGKKLSFTYRLKDINGLFPNERVYKTEYDSLKDSTQTLDMLLSHNSGKYEGDCEDFGRSLLTAYEMMKDYARKGEDKFSLKLYKGLQRYRIIGLDLKDHVINALITYNGDFSVATLEPIEPQIYMYGSKKLDTLADKLLIEDNKIYLISKYKNRKIEKKMITELYSSEVCYEQVRP